MPLSSTRGFIFTICAVVLLLSSAGKATDYYIDAMAGDDARDGMATTTAWKTLERIGRAPLQPGDRLLLKRDAVWHESLPVPASGAPGKPITYTAYGAGARPRIIATGYAVDIAGKSGITLEELDITGKIYAIFIHAHTGQYRDFVFRRCTITCLETPGMSAHGIHQSSDPIMGRQDGKRTAMEGTATFKNFFVSGCTITPGRNGWSNGINLHNNVLDFLIEDNIINPDGEDAILLWNCANGRVSNNTMGGNGENSIDIKNSSDINVSHNTCINDTFGAILLHEIYFLEGHKPNNFNQRIVIEYNTITGAGQWFKRARSAPEITAGIWINMSDDCTVRYNKLTDCLGDGISIDDAESSLNNNMIYGNIIAGCGQQDWNGGIALGDCVGTKIFNNLIYRQRAGSGVLVRGGAHTQGLQLHNNIITVEEKAPPALPGLPLLQPRPPLLVQLRQAGKDLLCDNNCYWPDSENGFQGGSLARGNFTAWQKALLFDTNSLMAEPKFADALHSDFTLANDSPCISRAKQITGYTRDADGNIIPQEGTAADIGPCQTIVPERLRIGG